MGVESMEGMNKKAYEAVREAAGGAEFMEKYEKIKPFLETKEYALDIEKREKIKQREVEDSNKLSEVKTRLVEKMNTVSTDTPNFIGIERAMFSPKKVQERANNRIKMMFTGKNPEAVGQQWSEKAKEVLQKHQGVTKGAIEKKLSYPEQLAQSAALLREGTTLNTPEKRAQNVIKLNQRIEDKNIEKEEKKSKAQKLAAWWKRLNNRDAA